MFRKFTGWLVVVGVVLGMLPDVSAHALTTYHQKAWGLSIGRTRTLNDYHVHFVKSPKRYNHATRLHGNNTIRSVQGAHVNFATKILFPYPGYHNQAWGNPQSTTTNGRYLYVLYTPTAWHNRGRIVRYDLKKLDQLGASPREIQTAYTESGTIQKAVRKAVKVGPAFTTGHGQSLAYNWHDHQLYMWCDREKSAAVPTSIYGYIQQISSSKLVPHYRTRFRLRSNKGDVNGGHVLAFDKYGNAYFWSRPGGQSVRIYKGRISRHHMHFRLTHQILRRGPGTHVQSMGYNPHNGRLYLVADDSIASLPAKKLNGNGRLTKNDVKWTQFSPRREFEGLAFLPNGHALLLSNHNPEVLISDRTSW
ncbi:hypothetical protein ACFQET_00380 [Levilactobacillus tangyuanensis]|uniref:Extracellular protein n=1 Tax=Levilactobacillus tangyuanensis TaxID=2486021 RepID=A0ABW1TMM5_9LACO|nr:hypothetical protein [Levilactobacillus tangyuanensis]